VLTERTLIQRQIAVIADHPIAMPGMPDAAHDENVRVYTLSEGIAALAERAAPDVAIVDISATTETALALLATIDALADAGALIAIVIFARDCIDAVAARIGSTRVTLLCEPSPAERIAAIGFAVEGGRSGVLETGNATAPGLQSLADEVARIARALAALAEDTPRASGIGDMLSDGLVGYRAEPPTPGSNSTAVGAGEVRAMIKVRRLRERYLPPALFGEPAWDILLDLCAARIERTRVAVSSLCIAAAVPPTTALRTIRTMTEQGLLNRVADATDKRRVFIELAEPTAAAMQAYIAAARSI
jgi:DNA-binding MarR family transcriptional regulator/DNA-binding NarL/FixJ family response regulator